MAALRFVPSWVTATGMELTFRALRKEAYKGNSAVYACVQAHALAFPEPPLVVQRKTKWRSDEVPGHRLRELIQNPNHFMGEAEF